MTTRRLLLTVAFLLVLAASGLGQANNVILGKVRGNNGMTLNNAIVELRRGGGEIMGQTVTRNDGDFSFSGLAFGEYEVAVTLSGYEPAVEVVRFKLPPGMATIETLRVEIMLKPRGDALLATPGVNFAQDVPKAARAAFDKGIARLREGKTAEGIELLNQATGIYNDYFNAHFALATEYYRLEKYSEALQSVERARQINDRESAVYYLFGMVMVKQRKVSVAEYAFREAVRLNGANIPARFYHGVTLTELGIRGNDPKQADADLMEAEKELNSAWDLSGKRLSGVHLELYKIHNQKNDKEAAARDLENFLKAEPNAKNAGALRETIQKLRGKH